MREDRPPRLPKLDARLRGIAHLVPECELAADIGCDHGRLGLHLLHTQKVRHMVFADISDKSLDKARKLLAFHQLAHRATFVVADGLAALKQPVDAVVISGLGGDTILEMIANGTQHIGQAKLILSAHTETVRLRTGLAELGFNAQCELVMQSRGRYYTAIKAQRQAQPQASDARALFVGHQLKAYGGASVAGYLRWRLAVLQQEKNPSALHMQWLREEIQRGSGNQPNHL